MMHLPVSLLLDLQALYPKSLVPAAIASLPEFYISKSSDPLVGGVMGLLGDSDRYVWFKSLLMLEAVFQVPVFIIGMRGLWKDARSIYVLLLIYAASTATTTLPCLAVILSTPILGASNVAAGVVPITSEQRLMLLSSYVPFLILPLFMTVDMALRLWKLLEVGNQSQLAAKTK
ncbi:Transmembrane protein [Sparassis crispa]|uniref:Efficient mitochondria targeting-associated protein 19 n=1 Tax=Sparassis crispa TaxID=139825 RepID=A0A401GZH8_9APHY|nr:Transmembrane protein [Sparassis crispa]GBE87558.1 Transmembrane protein [Sparassis crispa]